MGKWTLEETDHGLRLVPLRALGFDRFTWAHLLYGRLSSVQVCVFYFPSRFGLPEDKHVIDVLRTFGVNTGLGTSVDIWDMRDSNIEKALELFDVKYPPALVFVSGLQLKGINPLEPDKANLYAITITNMDVLISSDKLPLSINRVHDILMRNNPQEITSYVRTHALHTLLQTLATVAKGTFDEIVKLRPKFQLPDGSSLQLGE